MQWNMQALLSLSDAMLKELRLVLTCHFDPSDAGLDGPPTRTDVPVLYLTSSLSIRLE